MGTDEQKITLIFSQDENNEFVPGPQPQTQTAAYAVTNETEN